MKNDNYIVPMLVALALSTGCGKLGCGKDERAPPRCNANCYHQSEENRGQNVYHQNSVKNEHDIGVKGNYAKPNHDMGQKNSTYTTPQGVQYVIQLPPGYRAVTVVPNGPVITTRFRTTEGGAMPPKNPHLSGHNPYVETERRQRMPSGRNPAGGSTGCSGSPAQGSGSSGSSAGTGASGNAEPSLEQRLRDCEELNRQLEQQVTDSMNPDDDHGRG